MDEFSADGWRDLLAFNGLDSFDALWNLQVPWFEELNRCRGGWSGVSRCELMTPAGEKRGVFLKRQENHGTFSWCHPLRGIPTFLREFRLIQRYQAAAIPSLEPVYFGMRDHGKGHRAILMTAELAGFTSLDVLATARCQAGLPEPRDRRRILEAVAALTRKMHRCNIQHNCYYPKHIFIRADENVVEARVIDLEKSGWRAFPVLCALRDLDSLNRHASGWSRSDRMRFLMSYLEIARMTPYAKWLWRRLAARGHKKRRERPAAQ